MELKPFLSVLMPVYNGQLYLKEAAESILNQTFCNFEFIIIDDGSTDNTPNIINNFKDERIIYLRNYINMGVTEALNRGLKIVRGAYIVRMDADDISLPERLERQITYLDKHPEVGLLGSSAQYIDEKGKPLFISVMPETHNKILWMLYFDNCFMHTSVVFRHSILRKAGNAYQQGNIYGQDYGLWVKMSGITKMANLPEVLVKIRIHQNAISTVFQAEQRKVRINIMKQAIGGILMRDIPITPVNYLLNAVDNLKLESNSQVKIVTDLLLNLYSTFTSKKLLSRVEYRYVKTDIASKICNMAYNNLKEFPRASLCAVSKAFILSPFSVIFLASKRLRSILMRFLGISFIIRILLKKIADEQN